MLRSAHASLGILLVCCLLVCCLLGSAQAAIADEPPATIDDLTSYSFVTPAGPLGSVQTKTITRVFPGNILFLQLKIESGTADDTGYVGNQLVTPLLPVCAGPASATPDTDVSQQVTIDGNTATFQLIAQENCCCLTGWGHETEKGRADATFHWHVTFGTFFELVDPNPDLTDQAGSLSTSDSARATSGKPVKGAAADDLTVILERVKAPGAGTVTFSIPNWPGVEDGGVSADGSARMQSVMVKTTPVGPDFYAFAYYRVPEDFNPPEGGDENRFERQIQLQVDFAPSDPTVMAKSSTLPLRLYRPPVVLVHGLWSNAWTWTFGLTTNNLFAPITYADYSTTAGSSFATNDGVVQRYIEIALSEMRSNNIAATQADVVTHSMGGVLSRIYIGSPQYRRKSNFMQGDVHKFITLDTPHNGTPIASDLVKVRSARPSFSKALVVAVAKFQGGSIDDKALDDLSLCSGPIQQIPGTPAASHSLVGTGVSDNLYKANCLVAEALGLVSQRDCSKDPTLGARTIFGGEANDGIVNVSSQQGGLIDPLTTVLTDPGSCHTCVTSSGEYSDAIVSLLNQPPSSTVFGPFPAPACPPPPNGAANGAAPHPLDTGPSQEVVEGLSLAVPFNFVSPGDQVPVTVTPANGFVPTNVLLLAPGVVQDLGSSLTGTFTVPPEAAGNLDIVAVGFDANGIDSVSDPATLIVLQQANLLSVRLSNRPAFFLGTGETQQFGLLGFYDDGVVRDLTDPSTGTQFTSIDPTILQISASGLATTVASGTTAIYASNQGVADTAEVIVQQSASPPIANPGPGETVACTSAAGAQVTLNGSGSSDPAGLPLSFLWTGSFGQASGEVVTVGLPIGSSNVTLTVNDSQGGTASASTVIVVAALTPPNIAQALAQPSSLWPPNHKMVPVTVSANAMDACDATPSCSITSVTGNEPIDGDYAIAGPLTVNLRATRLGSGTGRIYTLGVTCTDAFGNQAQASVSVTVPHDQGN
jgi:pimeloyl-ACP methyl ester carboxylesterase